MRDTKPLSFEDLLVFRTYQCNKDHSREEHCLGEHSNIKQLRRPPLGKDDRTGDYILRYSRNRCSHFSDGDAGSCPKGNSCEKAHTKDEVIFHPELYLSRPCKNAYHDGHTRIWCAFYHNTEERELGDAIREKLDQYLASKLTPSSTSDTTLEVEEFLSSISGENEQSQKRNFPDFDKHNSESNRNLQDDNYENSSNSFSEHTHGKDFSRKNNKPLCVYYQRGICRNGPNCNFVHAFKSEHNTDAMSTARDVENFLKEMGSWLESTNAPNAMDKINQFFSNPPSPFFAESNFDLLELSFDLIMRIYKAFKHGYLSAQVAFNAVKNISSSRIVDKLGEHEQAMIKCSLIILSEAEENVDFILPPEAKGDHVEELSKMVRENKHKDRQWTEKLEQNSNSNSQSRPSPPSGNPNLRRHPSRIAMIEANSRAQNKVSPPAPKPALDKPDQRNQNSSRAWDPPERPEARNLRDSSAAGPDRLADRADRFRESRDDLPSDRPTNVTPVRDEKRVPEPRNWSKGASVPERTDSFGQNFTSNQRSPVRDRYDSQYSGSSQDLKRPRSSSIERSAVTSPKYARHNRADERAERPSLDRYDRNERLPPPERRAESIVRSQGYDSAPQRGGFSEPSRSDPSLVKQLQSTHHDLRICAEKNIDFVTRVSDFLQYYKAHVDEQSLEIKNILACVELVKR